ncbi:hypothetical protein Mapa_017355 [Marchantia paleacea]|nr:hypothetical protein Mapa_017355 [Marchantia paleacea]
MKYASIRRATSCSLSPTTCLPLLLSWEELQRSENYYCLCIQSVSALSERFAVAGR